MHELLNVRYTVLHEARLHTPELPEGTFHGLRLAILFASNRVCKQPFASNHKWLRRGLLARHEGPLCLFRVKVITSNV